jgi:hypothetical protein
VKISILYSRGTNNALESTMILIGAFLVDVAETVNFGRTLIIEDFSEYVFRAEVYTVCCSTDLKAFFCCDFSSIPPPPSVFFVFQMLFAVLSLKRAFSTGKKGRIWAKMGRFGFSWVQKSSEQLECKTLRVYNSCRVSFSISFL